MALAIPETPAQSLSHYGQLCASPITAAKGEVTETNPYVEWIKQNIPLLSKQKNEPSAKPSIESTENAPKSDETAKTIESLENLRILATNWSGYGDIPIDGQLIAEAKQVVHSVASSFASQPKIVPMSKGRLQMEWHKGNRSLELEFEKPGQLHFLKWDPENSTEEEDVVPTDNIAAIRNLVNWFHMGLGDA